MSLTRFCNTAFGVVLPVACFVLDHMLDLHVYGPWSVPAREFVAVELGLFLWYSVREPASAFVRGGMVAAFAVGAAFAWITAVCLLHVSLFGVLILIGLLGLVPFGTAIVYAVAAARLVSKGSQSASQAISGGVVALLVAVGPALAWRSHEVGIVKRARAELVPGVIGGPRRADQLLDRLAGCDAGRLSSLYESGFSNLYEEELDSWLASSLSASLSSFMETRR